MGRFATFIKALGIGLQAAVEGVQTASVGMAQATSGPWFQGSDDQTPEPPEVPNPYLDSETAEHIFETLDHQVLCLWPLVHVNNGLGFTTAYNLLSCQAHLHTQDRTEDRRGISFEVARLVMSYLDEDQDPDDLPGVSGALGVGAEADFRPHLGAFMDASIRGDLEAAVKVADLAGEDARVLFPGLTDEAQHRKGLLAFLAGAITSLSRQWSLEQVPEVLGVETDD